MSRSSEGISFTITFDQTHADKLQVLLMRTGLKDYAQLVEESMTLLAWAVEQVEGGKELAAYSRKNNSIYVEAACLPSLVHIASLRESLENESD